MKEFLVSLSRFQKRLLLIFTDIVTISFALWISLSARQDSFFNFSNGYELTGTTASDLYLVLLLANITIISLLIFFRLYRSITRYISIETYAKITKASIIGTGIWALLIYNMSLPFPRSVFIIFFVTSTLLLFLSRYSARSFLTHQKDDLKKQCFNPAVIEDKLYFYQKGRYVEIDDSLYQKIQSGEERF